MSTTIECTQCGDAVAVESRSVTLPFVCMQCEAAVEDFDATTQLYEDMAPATTQSFPQEAIDRATVTQEVPEMTVYPVVEMEIDSAYEDPSVTDNLSEEFASVENTTLLIEDLEQQLVEAKHDLDYERERNADFLQHIEAARDTISTLQTTADDRLVEINGLEAQLDEMSILLVKFLVKATEDFEKLAKQVKTAELTLEIEKQNSRTLKDQRDESLEYRTFWKDQAKNWREKLEAERDKSLWQRVKEALYDQLP
jgi:hypothetical protein